MVLTPLTGVHHVVKSNTPRISVNKLAEYVVSKGARQRQILRDQKFPQDFKVTYYREASEAIAKCIASNLEDISSLELALKILEQQSPEKIGAQRRVTANVDAIETFMSMMDNIELMGATPTLGAHAPQKLMKQNVEISVRPEIILRGKGKSKKSLVGAMKLHFPRTFPLNAESASYVSAITYEYSHSHLAGEEEAHGPYCMVIDIGSKAVYPGIKSTVQKLKDVAAECRNIAGLWPTITETE